MNARQRRFLAAMIRAIAPPVPLVSAGVLAVGWLVTRRTPSAFSDVVVPSVGVATLATWALAGPYLRRPFAHLDVVGGTPTTVPYDVAACRRNIVAALVFFYGFAAHLTATVITSIRGDDAWSWEMALTAAVDGLFYLLLEGSDAVERQRLPALPSPVDGETFP